MPIINARDNENNRRKGNAKIKNPKKPKHNKTKNKDRKGQGVIEAIMKVAICKASLIFKSNLGLALSIISK